MCFAAGQSAHLHRQKVAGNCWNGPDAQTPGKIWKVDPPKGFLESYPKVVKGTILGALLSRSSQGSTRFMPTWSQAGNAVIVFATIVVV